MGNGDSSNFYQAADVILAKSSSKFQYDLISLLALNDSHSLTFFLISSKNYKIKGLLMTMIRKGLLILSDYYLVCRISKRI